MSLVLFAHSMFGNLIALRILRKFRDRSLISTTCLTKIGTAFALFLVFLSLGVGFWQPFAARNSIFVVFGALITLKFSLRALESHRIEILLGHFPRFLDHWLLHLHVGMSPKSAAECALNGADPVFQTLLRPLLSSSEVRIEGKQHLFLHERLLREIRYVHIHPHNAVARLDALRDFVRRENDFRRKSGQALRQASIQSWVMLALHFALCTFAIARSGWNSNFHLILVSSALSCAGAVSMRWMARRIKWTI